jgi:hypothetical protein
VDKLAARFSRNHLAYKKEVSIELVLQVLSLQLSSNVMPKKGSKVQKSEKFIIWIICLFIIRFILIYPSNYLDNLFGELCWALGLGHELDLKYTMLFILIKNIVREALIPVLIGVWLYFSSDIRKNEKFTWFVFGVCFSYNSLILFFLYNNFKNQVDIHKCTSLKLRNLSKLLSISILALCSLFIYLIIQYVTIEILRPDLIKQMTLYGNIADISPLLFNLSVSVWIYFYFRNEVQKTWLWSIFSLIAGSYALLLLLITNYTQKKESQLK